MATDEKSSVSSPDLKHTPDTSELSSVVDQDELQLNRLGYKQQLHRSWNFIENFSASFVAVNPINFLRAFLFIGLLSGGPAAIWSSFVISVVFVVITAAVLAEICSALPTSGSIYSWAAASAGPKYARFFGFIVAWWASAGWMTVPALASQASAGTVASQLSVWGIDFPGGAHNDNVKWRVFIWALSEGFLLLAVITNYLPPKLYSSVLRVSTVLCFLDFFLCLIWLPIGVSRTYGFRSAKEVFTTTYNGTGAPSGWNWILCFLSTTSPIVGFDASGHVAEETRHANVVAARGMLTTALLTGSMGLIATILFLFCIPDLDTLLSLDAPQPFIQVYAMALGKGPSVLMTAIAVINFVTCSSTVIVAASRLIFAVARDGVLPFSSWVGQVDNNKQPRNAVTVAYVFSACMLCAILPSQVAFTSLTSSSIAFVIATYGIVALLRLLVTPGEFKWSKFKLGPFAKFFYAAAAIFNAIVFAVQISPFFFPVTAETFNFAGVIFCVITIFAILSWWFIPEDRWLPKELLTKVFDIDGDYSDTQTI